MVYLNKIKTMLLTLLLIFLTLAQGHSLAKELYENNISYLPVQEGEILTHSVRPMVVRGCCSMWQALLLWTPEYLKQALKQQDVPVLKGNRTFFRGTESNPGDLSFGCEHLFSMHDIRLVRYTGLVDICRSELIADIQPSLDIVDNTINSRYSNCIWISNGLFKVDSPVLRFR